MRQSAIIAALCLGLISAPAWACADIPAQARQVQAAQFRLIVTPVPAPIPLNKPFALDIRLCDGRMAEFPQLTAVDARMPAHRHGMNYKPALTKIDWGHYRAEGLLLHMPGNWEFSFDFTGAGKRERLTFSFDAQ
ncbi:hypothetical protein [Ferrovibrio sp.]|uniref:hypothetical protein n=1 Tax=Ferrovibrio sp. TaxID=1917215 RepID=UPI000CC5EAE0|nr:hypothetical protein [Ferrovibrio sp.]PJI39179.1 MAG: hypothetical protein CTR53_14880 [Ferrovibrio sp.]